MMKRELRFTDEAATTLRSLEKDRATQTLLQQIRKTLGFLETNPRHPSLKTHKYDSINGPNGEEVFEAYAQNKTPGAYRVFFVYGPDEAHGKKRVAIITIVAITRHP